MGSAMEKNPPVQLSGLHRRAGPESVPTDLPAKEKGEGDGGKNFAPGHTQHDQPHGALWVLGEKADQQTQNQPGADKLLAQLHRGGRADAARAIEKMLVQVFHPGEQNARQQEQQP